MATPRYRCAAEKGFIPAPKPYVWQRVEQGMEFDFDGEPGNWMDPVNDEAFERVEARVAAMKRKTVNAPVAAQTVPVTPPRSGMAMPLANPIAAVRDTNVDDAARHQAPRRRATRSA